jgi:hypothetical protein
MYRNKVHAHNNFFEQALFFAASPDDLGLTEANGFGKLDPHIPTRTDSVGFVNNSDARRFFMRNLRKAQESFDAKMLLQNRSLDANITDERIKIMLWDGLVASKSKIADCGFPNPPCVELRPKIVCQALGVLKEVMQILVYSPIGFC